MKLKHSIVLFWIVISFGNLFAQKEGFNWYFANKVGLTFHTTPPSTLPDGKINTVEGCATISTKEGRLLFYTDGISVWDSTHNLMPNGTGLKGHSSSTQSGIIVPKPNDPNIYYIFTVIDVARTEGLRYSVVDMRLNSGKGDIISSSKNTQLATPVCEKISAANNGNGTGYWVIAHKYDSDTILAYSVTENGVNPTPVRSNTGIPITSLSTSTIGYLKVAPDGKKLAYVNYTLPTAVVADFDNITGKVSNVWDFNFTDGYGLEFSPASKFLYIADLRAKKIFQYDLYQTTKPDFLASKYEVVVSQVQAPASLQLGPDGKIYCSLAGAAYLAVIHAPDSGKAACRFQTDYVYLSPKYCSLGLPTFIPSFFINNTLSIKNNCINDSTRFEIKSQYTFDSIRWTFQEISTGTQFSFLAGKFVARKFPKEGKYLVKTSAFFKDIESKLNQAFTVYKPIKPYLGKDSLYCNDFSRVLSPQRKYFEYLWLNENSKQFSLNVSKPGTYILQTNDSGNCVASDTIVLDMQKIKAKLKASDTALCFNVNQFKLNNTSLFSNQIKTLTWRNLKDNKTSNNDPYDIAFSQAGNHRIRLSVENIYGCKDSVEQILTVFPNPKPFIGNDSTYCRDFNIDLKPEKRYKEHLWNTSDTDYSINVYKPGFYSIKVVDNNNCVGYDSITINVLPRTKWGISYDTVNCTYTYLSIDTSAGMKILWSTGETNSRIGVTKKGIYMVDVEFDNCLFKDTITVDRLPYPEFTLGPDQKFCSRNMILKSNGKGTSYLWSTGDKKPSIVVEDSGIYWLRIYDGKCFSTDSIVLSYCPDLVFYMPNAFTPNNDGTNEVFKIVGTGFLEIKFEIYNRWGEKLFESLRSEDGWDGTFNGNPCQQDVYFYKVSIKGNRASDTRFIQGTFHLLR
jgi:gliding motility-associated-like protein